MFYVNNSEMILEVGQNYSLICNISGSVEYMWLRKNNSELNTTSDSISFTPFKTSDVGNYSCTNKDVITDGHSKFQVLKAQSKLV